MPDITLRILVAEDEVHQRTFLERICQEAGHTVECVGDGETCLAALEKSRFDLLFLDLIMPGVDGIGVLRAMRKRTGKPMPRVVVVSSQDDESAIAETMDLGASVYLTKPVATATIRNVLDQMALRATLSGVQPSPPPT